MADDAPATFSERFPETVGNQSESELRQAAAAYQQGQYGRALSAGLSGLVAGAGETIAGLFTKSSDAFFKGLTPSQEIEVGANAALTQIGGGEAFRIPKGTAAAFDNFHDQVVKPTAQSFTGAPTQVEPPKNTDVPPSVSRSQLALTGEPHIDAILTSPVTKNVIDNPIVDRSRDVPYTAGGSVPLQDPTMFVDKNFPRAFSIDGKVFDPADPFLVHENVEQHTMDILTKGGMDNATAYKVAHFEFAEKAEGAWYDAHGIDQAKAEAAYRPYMDAIQKNGGTDFPPNLYDRPYPHDEPSAARSEAIAEPRPTPAEIDRAKQIIADWQNKPIDEQTQPEAAPRVNPIAQAHELGVIGPPRDPVPTDSPAAAAQRAIPANMRQGDKISETPAGEPIDAWEARFHQWVKDLKSPEEVKPLIEDSAAKNNNFPEARAGAINPAHVEVLADAAGLDPTKIDRGLLTQTFNTPDKIRMAKQLLDTTLQDFREAAAKVASDPSEANIEGMLAAEIKRDYALEQILGLRAEWGRSGHALRDLLEKVEGESKVNDLLKSKGRTPKDMEDMAKAIGNMDAPSTARLMTSMRGQQPHWFYWLWVNGLISGPFTHTKYVAANALYAASEHGVTTPLAAMIGRLRGDPEIFFGESPAALWGMVSSVPDALKAAGETIKSGMRVQLDTEKELIDRLTAAGETVPNSLLKTANPVTDLARPLPGVWGRIGGSPSDIASGIHTFFKVLGERASLDAWAYNKAASEGLKITDQAFWDRMAWHKANPTTAVLKDSVYQAYKDTFMRDLPTELARRAAALKGGKITGWIFPFTHIPINLMRATLEHTPFAFLDSEVRANLLGKNGRRAQDLAISRMVAGSSVMGYFTHKFMQGQATGGYPHDQKERREWNLSGKIPYAIQVGDQWRSFERFGPAGALAGLGADIGRVIAGSDSADPENWTKMVWYAAQAAADSMADFPGFQSIQNFIKAIDDPQEGKRFAAWEAGSAMIPFSSLVTQTASFMDPSMRRARTFVDGLLYRIPGMREDLAPKRDPLYGTPVPNPGYGAIIRTSPVQRDYGKSELDRIGYYPTAPANHIGGVKLSPQQYDKYEATAGPLVNAALNGLVRSPQWQAHKVNPEWQKQVAKSVISAARRKAAGALEMDDPSIIEAGRQRRLTQINGPR